MKAAPVLRSCQGVRLKQHRCHLEISFMPSASPPASSVPERRASFLQLPAVPLQRSQHLSPLLVPALHLNRRYGGKELLGGQVLGQPRQELRHVDEVHLGQDVLEELQDAQRRAEQELLAVAAEHVPYAAGQVQGQRFAI